MAQINFDPAEIPDYTKEDMLNFRLKIRRSAEQFKDFMGYESYHTVLRKESGTTRIMPQDRIVFHFLLQCNIKPLENALLGTRNQHKVDAQKKPKRKAKRATA